MARVLLIEDDRDIAKLMAGALTDRGHVVTHACDGAEGLVAFRRPDSAMEIVVTDILMPVQEGIETIMAIRQIDRTIPIIAISGGGTPQLDLLKTARALGANAALAKPFRPSQLAAMIEQLLEAKPAGS